MAPEVTGTLKGAIYASKGPDDKPGVIVGVNLKTAWYARLVEYGSSHNAAQPFFRPAVIAARGTVASLMAPAIRDLIERRIEELTK